MQLLFILHLYLYLYFVEGQYCQYGLSLSCRSISRLVLRLVAMETRSRGTLQALPPELVTRGDHRLALLVPLCDSGSHGGSYEQEQGVQQQKETRGVPQTLSKKLGAVLQIANSK